MKVKNVDTIKKCNGCGNGKKVIIKLENMENREGNKFDIYLCEECMIKICTK